MGTEKKNTNVICAIPGSVCAQMDQIIKMPFRLYYSFGKNYSNSQSAKAILKKIF